MVVDVAISGHPLDCYRDPTQFDARIVYSPAPSQSARDLATTSDLTCPSCSAFQEGDIVPAPFGRF